MKRCPTEASRKARTRGGDDVDGEDSEGRPSTCGVGRAFRHTAAALLVPTAEEQVQRITTQPRVYCLDGEPILATRDGAYFEDHGTFAALI